MTALLASVNMARLLSDLWVTLQATFAVSCAMLGLGIAVEKCVPNARAQSHVDLSFNLRYAAVLLVIISAFRPLTLAAALSVTHALGAGWIRFPPGTLGVSVAFVTVLVMTDLLEYLFHRAQHHFSFMWKMHELHHSAQHYNVTLSYRHFWGEPLLKSAFMYPLVGIVFQVPQGVGAAVGIVFMINHAVAHMNLRFSPRVIGFLISHPQYHRFHHSRHERDYNKNFCDLLPLWDILLGTHHRLLPDEFVDVGLDSNAAPASISEALLWPWRAPRKKLASVNLAPD